MIPSDQWELVSGGRTICGWQTMHVSCNDFKIVEGPKGAKDQVVPEKNINLSHMQRPQDTNWKSVVKY